ncbi:hypothetical protein ACPV5U_19215 [Vibrio mediterranei]
MTSNFKLSFIIISSLLPLSIFGAVSDIQQSTEGQRYSRVADATTATSNNPGYQTSSLGEIWSPKVNLNNADGNPNIGLDNAHGTPKISLDRAYGDISGTSGVNDSIRDSIGEGGNGPNPEPARWRVIHNTAPFDGTVSIPSQATMLKVTGRGVSYLRYGSNPTDACNWAKDSMLTGKLSASESFTLTRNEFAGGRHLITMRTGISGTQTTLVGLIVQSNKVFSNYHYIPINGGGHTCFIASLDLVEVYY